MKQVFLLIISSAIGGLLTFMLSCSEHEKARHKDYLIREKELIPEGVAFDPLTQTIYISSTYKRKIIAIDEQGHISDFISEGQDDIKSVIGMEVDSRRNCLWAVSAEAPGALPMNQAGSGRWHSSVYQYDLSNGKLIKKYELDKDSVFLNDVTVAPDGSVFITESIKGAVYQITNGGDSLQLFLEPKPYGFLNGICFTDKPGYLFIASTEGIISVDLATKKYLLLPAAGDNKALDIDGLTFTLNYFIAHQSSIVSRFYLSAARDSIISADTLDSGKEFDSSTTGEVSGEHYYYIVNSQIRSGVDFKNRKLKPDDSLSNIIIRKIKL